MLPDAPRHQPDQPAWYRAEICPHCSAGIVWDHAAAVPHYRCKRCAWVETRFDGKRNEC